NLAMAVRPGLAAGRLPSACADRRGLSLGACAEQLVRPPIAGWKMAAGLGGCRARPRPGDDDRLAHLAFDLVVVRRVAGGAPASFGAARIGVLAGKRRWRAPKPGSAVAGLVRHAGRADGCRSGAAFRPSLDGAASVPDRAGLGECGADEKRR